MPDPIPHARPALPGRPRTALCRARSRTLPLLVALLAAVAAGCGGTDQRPADDAATSDGEPTPALFAGWRTDWHRHTVPFGEFENGGPGRDGIPPLTEPRFEPVTEASKALPPDEPMIELVVDDAARAYPIRILIWHEIVNDTIGSLPVAVTFCPLCHTSVVFDRRVGDETLVFGTTGKLRFSDLVMYDRSSESWWQQFDGVGVVGRYAGTKLRIVPSAITTLADFAQRNPGGTVLSHDTGFDRPYGTNPYEGYDAAGSSTIFPAPGTDDRRLDAKLRVVFIDDPDDPIAIPLKVVARRSPMIVRVGSRNLKITFIAGVRDALGEKIIARGDVVGAARVVDTATGAPVAFDTPFWFAVATFRPGIRVVDR